MNTNSDNSAEKAAYKLLDDGTFVITNYNKSKPFSSFFPGVAGLKGIPMWAFYVNRNQGIASFGVMNKNNAITEFYAANNAYGLAATQGFRTFIKIKGANSSAFYEPFASNPPGCGIEPVQRMFVRPHELMFEDVNIALGLKTTARYFTLPNEPIAALMRTLEVENIGENPVELEVIDGLPKIIPYWMSVDILKHMSTTAQAWTLVTNLDKNIPFYRLKVEINDKTEVTELRKGNFYFGLVSSPGVVAKAAAIVDPEIVFGQDQAFLYPQAFMAESGFRVPKDQAGSNKYPSAMSFFERSLAPGGRVRLYSVTGHIDSEEKLNKYFKRAGKPEYFEAKSKENKLLIDGLTGAVATESAIGAFDLYCRNTYLDNLIRGGMPILLPAGGEKLVFYVYSRKHGDLERDYNFFHLSPTYYSQGNGNFRDMNQNKRSDVFFTPAIKDFNVTCFYNLLQLDGYNPLLVKGSTFFLDAAKPAAAAALKKCVAPAGMEAVKKFFSRRYEPGSLLIFVEEKGIKLKVTADEFLRVVLGASEWTQESEHGEGYWVDHWTYNLDLLESYLAVYPENLRHILFEKKDFTFFDNTHIVVPRSEKHVDANGKIRQFDSVILDTRKAKLLRARHEAPHLVRTENGAGEIYRTTLMSKMACLIVNKLATLDPEGIGIEMEAEKPGWYDALNGLPGVFGSSVCETFELKRLITFLTEKISQLGMKDNEGFSVPQEVFDFMGGLEKLLGGKGSDHKFWDAASALKEFYRKETELGVTGNEKTVTVGRLLDFFGLALRKINRGLAKAKDAKTGLYRTYFSYEAVSYKKTDKISHKGWPCVDIKKFKKRALPLFLEAEVHYLKTPEGRRNAAGFHGLVKKSPLYDKQLGMYKVNASLKKEPADIGRCTVFTPGWLENESIWLHMEYKYVLELLKSGLYKEFFTEFKKTCVCFLPPEKYGRSVLENSSFLASSAFSDKNNWGRGFVARLSGSTAEFIEMWLIMTCGAKPFTSMGSGHPVLSFKPALAKECFTKNNTFSFTFLGRTKVTYHNPSRRDLFGDNTGIEKMVIYWDDGSKETLRGGLIPSKEAVRIRELEAKSIEVYFL